eukprot:4533925-Prymnesium_polylepis.1
MATAQLMHTAEQHIPRLRSAARRVRPEALWEAGNRRAERGLLLRRPHMNPEPWELARDGRVPLLRQSQRLLSKTKAPSSLAQCISSADADNSALISPQQSVHLTYGALDDAARRLAFGLQELGYGRGSVLVSNVPNVAENVLLQLALSHLGGALATPRKGDELSALRAAHD